MNTNIFQGELTGHLQRVSPTIIDYNPRAMRSYEKADFQVEGRSRETILKEGRRHGLVYMENLKEDYDDYHRLEQRTRDKTRHTGTTGPAGHNS